MKERERERSSARAVDGYKGSFINYIRVPREEGLEKSVHTLTLGRGDKRILM